MRCKNPEFNQQEKKTELIYKNNGIWPSLRNRKGKEVQRRKQRKLSYYKSQQRLSH